MQKKTAGCFPTVSLYACTTQHQHSLFHGNEHLMMMMVEDKVHFSVFRRNKCRDYFEKKNET